MKQNSDSNSTAAAEKVAAEKVAAEKVAAEKAAAKAKLVSVKAAVHLFEDGTTHKPGDVFEVSPERVKALGDLVTPAA